MNKETPRCKKCGEKTIEWFKHQILAGYHCSYCGTDIPLTNMNQIKKVIEESLMAFDTMFNTNILLQQDETKSLYMVNPVVKHFLSTTISNILSAIEAEVEKNDIKSNKEHELNGWLVGYNDCTSDIQELLNSAKEIIK
jgi:hypothetical protein